MKESDDKDLCSPAQTMRLAYLHKNVPAEEIEEKLPSNEYRR